MEPLKVCENFEHYIYNRQVGLEEYNNKKISEEIKKQFFSKRVRKVGCPGYKSPFKNL